MLNVFKSGGRHSWSNAQYDQLLKEGAPLSGDPERRSQMMKDAERVLVEDVPAIWVYHQLIGELLKPYLKGSNLEPNKTGLNGEQWPGFTTCTLAIPNTYIGQEVSEYRS
jgi:ABC-type oligopeptide transport system substrate-binding subunit